MKSGLLRKKVAGDPNEAPASSQDISFQGIPVVIEWPKGTQRSGTDAQGQPWQTEMEAGYGYIPDTVGKGDGEDLDCYVGEDEESQTVYIIEQLKEDGSFDEYKAMLGFNDPDQALATYQAHFPKVWEYDRVGGIWDFPVSRLAEIVDSEGEAKEQAMFDSMDAKADAEQTVESQIAASGEQTAPGVTASVKRTAAPAKNSPAKEDAAAAEKPKRGKYPKPGGYRNLLQQENAKTIKGEKLGYLTGILYLAPALEAGGRDLCPGRSAECTQGCLYDAGMASVFPTIKAARIAKTKFYFDSPEQFVESLKWDIEDLERKATRQGLIPAVRINGTSDIPKLAQAMAKAYPHIQFYDYTKLPKAHRRTTDNYHLTFSRSEENDEHVKEALANGINVAVVFNVKPSEDLPTEYMGHKVINGDEHDLRFLDEQDGGKPVIVGLRAKGPAKKLENGANNFVVRVEDLMKGSASSLPSTQVA